jgi:hypothetical protein
MFAKYVMHPKTYNDMSKQKEIKAEVHKEEA